MEASTNSFQLPHKTTLLILILALLLLLVGSTTSSTPAPPFSCDASNPSTRTYPFCQTSLPIPQRVHDLVSRLTLEEKVSQLIDKTPSIPRLGVPAYNWWSEALHGVAFIADVSERQGIHFNGSIRAATSFPQVILTSSSFDVRLWYRIGQAIGKEARAIYNAGQAIGMTFWSPNINIFRDPRWGRGQETPGEDPTLTGKYAVSFVRGLQGDSFQGGALGDHLQASACCKHFTAYDLDSWKNVTRYVFDAKVTQQDLVDTYQPPFHSCIQEAKASGIMCAYNRVNGVPNCADYDLLTNTARNKWGFHGYITSDCDAVSIIYEDQGYTKSPEDAVADVLKAGMDVNCGMYLKNYTKSALQKKKLTESDIDRALNNLFSVRMRLGLFSGNPKALPYGNIGPEQVCSEEHQALALEAARDGIVLLKNLNKLLPLSRLKTKTLAVIGPNSDAPDTLVGNYAGPPCKTVTPLKGLKNYVEMVKYHPGCSTVACSSAAMDKAVEITKGADNVVLVMGLDQTQEQEAEDRNDLVLPGKQQELITRVARAAKRPVILVLLCGGPVDVSFAKYDKKIGSILWAGYPGEAGGTALAEIIFGDHNPGGRLTMTWYPKEFTRIPMTDMRMRPALSSGYPGRTYRFYEGKKVFEFGYGLSYSNYSYEFVSGDTNNNNHLYMRPSTTRTNTNTVSVGPKSVTDLGAELCAESKLAVRVHVQNHGEMAGKHPVLLFVRHQTATSGRPIKSLVGFRSVHLNAGERKEVEYRLSLCDHLSTVDQHGVKVVEEGSYLLMVGDKESRLNVLA